MSTFTETQLEMIRLKQEGFSSRHIAKVLGVGKTSVNTTYRKYLESAVDTQPPEEQEYSPELDVLAEHPDFSVSNLAKRLRSAQKANTQLRKVHREVFDGEDNLNRLLNSVEAAIAGLNVVPVRVATPVPTNRQKATVELLFSDLQIGKVGEHYNTPKAKQALALYGSEVINYINKQSKEYDVERIIFASLGDIVEDHMKHGVQSAMATDSGLSQQMSDAITHIWQSVLEPLFVLGIKTDVMCIAGNHGSSQHKGMDMFKAGLFSYDYAIYKTFELLAKAKGFEHVNFIIPEGVFGYLNIYGNYAVYEHGYFNSATEKSMSDQMKKRGQQIKKHVEYFRCGDMHHTCSYDTHRIVLNGAFFGVDEGGVEYSGILGFSSIPSQVAITHVAEERLGRTTAKDFHLIQVAV